MIRSSTESRSAVCLAVASLILLGGCNDPVSTGSEPTHLEILQDVPPVGAPGGQLIDTLRVRLVDDEGRPQAGQLLTWLVRQGGGSIAPTAEETDAEGIAVALWTLGATTGPNEVEVSTLQDSSATWHTSAEAFRVDKLDSNSGLGCGLRQGDLWCWGQESWVESPPVSLIHWQSHYELFRAPGLVADGAGFTDLAVGLDAVCALELSGTVQCFRHPILFPTGSLQPTVPPMRRVAGADSYTFCGLTLADSTAWCWNVADGTGAPVPESPAFVDLEMESVTGSNIACGRLSDSTAACWGDGSLGHGTFDPSATPVPVSGGLHFAELAVGMDFACGRRADGEVWCWGRNGAGQLGNPGPDSPVPILANTGVGLIAAEQQTVLALRYGTPVRWGQYVTAFGGSPTVAIPNLPVASFSANDLSCMRLIDGQVYCFQELWLTASTFDVDLYSPVQPVVE